MKIGASTLCGMHGTPCSAVEALAERGFRCIEFVFESPHLVSRRDVAKLSRLGREYGLDYSLHGPWVTHNLGHMDGEVQRMNRRLFSRCIQAAATLKATHLVTHGSRIQALYGNVGFPKEELRDLLIRELRPVVQEAAGKGVRLVCENTFSFGESFTDARTLFEVIEATGAGYCLDVAHADLSDQRQKLLRVLPDYVHAADADLKLRRDLHGGIGKGNVDFNWWAEALKGRGYDGKIIMEVIAVNDMCSSCKSLLRMWEKASGSKE